MLAFGTPDTSQRLGEGYILPQNTQKCLKLGAVLRCLLNRRVRRRAGPGWLFGVERRRCRGAWLGFLCGEIRHGCWGFVLLLRGR